MVGVNAVAYDAPITVSTRAVMVHPAPQAQCKVHYVIPFNIVVDECAAVLELTAVKYYGLLVRGDSFLVLDLLFYILAENDTHAVGCSIKSAS